MGSAGGDGDLLVAEVFRQGYTLKGRVVRPAGVRVAHES
jgi:molecular chaperone GrpE (heat shock protein)